LYRPSDTVLIGVEAMERLTDYLRVREAAEFLGVSANTLRNWGRDGKIAEFRHPLNNYRLYRRDDLTAVLRGACEPTRRRVSKRRERATG
jgi:MerR family copper efflux transcriptional regulator